MCGKKYHICIVGSGIGVSSLLTSVNLEDVDVTIIEAGGEQSSDSVRNTMSGRKLGLRTTTAIQLGGTSNLWHGVLSPLDRDDFDSKDYIQNSGWPIKIDELEPFYKKASEILGLHNSEFFELDKLPKALKVMMEGLSFNRSLLKNKIFQQPLPPKNFRTSVIKDLKTKKNVTLLSNHVALQLFHNNSKVTGVKVGLQDGTVKEISADIFIVGAGALETPRLLLNSGIENYNIGRYLMDHPMGNLCQIEFKKPKKAPLYSDTKISKDQKIKSALVLKPDQRKKMKLLNHAFYLRPSFIRGIDNESEKLKLSLLAFKDGKTSLTDVWKLMTNINVIFQILAYKLSLNVTFKYADLFFVCEQTPNPNSLVSLSTKVDKWGYPIADVHWQVSDEDIENMKEWFQLVINDFFPESEYSIVHGKDDFNWEEIYTSAIHHVGTARMSHYKETGVVDKNLKVFDYDNLYVCDGSVFSTSGNVNSSFTISALACRLSQHLKDKFKL
jgi:choline dehydrogenase-like flavoprotein